MRTGARIVVILLLNLGKIGREADGSMQSAQNPLPGIPWLVVILPMN